MSPAQVLAKLAHTSTTVFFLHALDLLQPDLIGDIGSRNGHESLLFRSVVPGARIVACEANPVLVSRMRADPELASADIEVVHCAVSNAGGTAVLQIADRDLGNGSLRRWSARDTLERVTVPTGRLDRILVPAEDDTVALWIDVEGLAFEALDGAGTLLEATVLVHVEVETTERWQGAHLMEDVVALMETRGFRSAYQLIDPETGQGDIVFVHQGAKLSEARLCSKIVRYALYRPLARLANAVDLKQKMPGVYDALRRTVGVFLKRSGR